MRPHHQHRATKKRLGIFSVFLFVFFGAVSFSFAQPEVKIASLKWQPLDDGIRYSLHSWNVKNLGVTPLHLFEITPGKKKFHVLRDEQNHGTGKTAEYFARKHHMSLVVNGGFFTPEGKSIGLLVENGKILNSLHPTSWWSIFSIRGDKAEITRPEHFQFENTISFALQAGPRILIQGKVPQLKDERTHRTAIGITRDGKIILAIAEGVGLYLKELGTFLGLSEKDGGPACLNAMSLDGGSSTQVYAQFPHLKLQVRGRSNITNAVGIQ
ncbi:MAG: hypothetical protein COX62_06515 [Deltaproteobacteria bacterium CG_4_10_14_0_2_um_filter_43_8]|nr:MAG: hypothetical protein COV43_07460 [Deltaproteobacteria bacterium CG11_big_fil_rev_8_21_14_0_20_42_23]PJA19568.1 MAG: hypothetical protein COX62_06515 [Deltaproteobacteria bacterium CG_4_10_14_0_2_um_filter_43_8]PJC63943.1 MAG: hypothetical protein CO021_06955 [Deltaproteobacteria bacterium CG_4_9_14_0_2_um_filter_42_21]